uniref:Uncharacterized protein n=1 Tax=Arundo donax TaxID=35708 RepID=A0A0A8YI96_ARUDO
MRPSASCFPRRRRT